MSSSDQTDPPDTAVDASSVDHKRSDPTTVVKNNVRRIGPYLLGPRLCNSPVPTVVHHLGRRDGTDNFYSLKVLTISDCRKETKDDRQGRMLLHTEFRLLSRLQDDQVPGVVRHHGFFRDLEWDRLGPNSKRYYLVLDCVYDHDLLPRGPTRSLVNLQHYVIKERLEEFEAVSIFYRVVRVVESLHHRNIVHRDIKLGNVVLDKSSGEVRLTNLCLGKQLTAESELLTDQRGSPAYISPDVLRRGPYLGKPSDMWALGVMFYTMLYGYFPFYHDQPSELFRRIQELQYTIPLSRVSERSVDVIRKLLVLDVAERLTAAQVAQRLRHSVATSSSQPTRSDSLQVVPDIDTQPPDSQSSDSQPAKKKLKVAVDKINSEPIRGSVWHPANERSALVSSLQSTTSASSHQTWFSNSL